MKNSTIIAGILFLIVLVGGFVFVGSHKDTNGEVISGSGDTQEITLSVKNYNYYPDVIKVKSGQPVEITLDKSVSGCLRAFTVKDLGVSKVSKNPSETIDFTPTKKGTFTFACTMGMGYGKLIVE